MGAGDRFFIKPGDGEQIEILSDMVLGRHKDCDIILTDGHPSRRHAQILVSDTGISLEDLGSANGSFVNGAQISSISLLKNGDILKFDTCEYHFIIESLSPVAESNDQTIIRPVADLEQTVIRPAAELLVEAAELKSASGSAKENRVPAKDELLGKQVIKEPVKEAAKEPAKESAKESAKPVAWIDNPQSSEGTQVFSREQLAKMAAELSDEKSDSSVSSSVPCLKLINGASRGSEIRLSAGEKGGEWTIGSDASRDIVVEGDGVSAFHAKIVNEGARWKLMDQMAANGTFINGDKALVSYLNSGDRIRLGSAECVFMLPESNTISGQSTKESSGTSVTNNHLVKGGAVFVAVLGLLLAAYMMLG